MTDTEAIGLLEITGLSPALVALDAVGKSADVRLLQVELNDLLGVVLKVAGNTSAVEVAIEAGRQRVEQMGVTCMGHLINAPDHQVWPIIDAPREYSPLLEADLVFFADYEAMASPTPDGKEHDVAQTGSFAIGLIETQGYTAVIEAIDTACKTAKVEVVGREKLGGGYVTVIVKGDVASVRAAVDAGKAKVQELGVLIAAHVIARPSDAVLALIPRP